MKHPWGKSLQYFIFYNRSLLDYYRPFSSPVLGHRWFCFLFRGSRPGAHFKLISLLLMNDIDFSWFQSIQRIKFSQSMQTNQTLLPLTVHLWQLAHLFFLDFYFFFSLITLFTKWICLKGVMYVFNSNTFIVTFRSCQIPMFFAH